jgi:hypothetical protein
MALLLRFGSVAILEAEWTGVASFLHAGKRKKGFVDVVVACVWARRWCLEGDEWRHRGGVASRENFV